MLISCNKLKKYIKDSEKIDWLNIWSKFTIRTAEVESVKKVGDQIDNVVIAQIVSCEEHPNSDHMHILQVDCGEKDLIQVVCGAPNIRVGLKTALIKVGGHIDGFEITKRPLRGIDSNGMCCSKKELGIGDDHSGIIELPEDAPIGMDIKKYLPIEDIIVEIDNKSLTNRPDLWGHYGIAREVAAITNQKLMPLDILKIENTQEDLDISIKNPDLCYRYCGLKIDNIKNNETPLEMQIFLFYTGMRSISLLVDLTNYVMLELGQPMHAFDSRVVKKIEVDTAKENDVFQTLDKVQRKLKSDTLMIKNADEYFGIAGIIGGLDSEILPDTDSIFLESATFNAGSIRKTAVNLGLRTEASARYEKSLDPNMAPIASERFAYLLKVQNPDMQIASNLTDIYPTKLESVSIKLRKSKLKTYLGTKIDDELIKDLLEKIGFEITINEDDYDCLVPTFRHSKDINIEQDIIEEIARLYGLENFTPKALKLDLISNELENTFTEEYNVKKLLAQKYDMHEVNSYIWYDTNLLKELNIEKNGVKLLGKTENNVLRDDLSLSLMNIVQLNFKNYTSFKIFEIGTIIKNNENKRVLSVILADEESNLEKVYNLAKNIVNYVFNCQKNINVDFAYNETCQSYYENKLSKNIIFNDEKLGEINVLTKKITNKIGKKKAIVCIDIDFDKYCDLKYTDIVAKQVSKYPVVSLDYTIVIGKNQKYIDLKNVLSGFKSNLIIKYELVSIYDNKYTIRYTLGSNNKTLEQNDLQKYKERFIKYIQENNMLIME